MLDKKRNALVWGLLWCGWCCAAEGTTERSDQLPWAELKSVDNTKVQRLNKAFSMPEEKPIHFVIVSRRSDEPSKKYDQLIQESKDKLFEEINERINTLPEDELKIIIFNETFFDKSAPVSSSTKDDILEKLKKIGRNTLIVVNFLYKESKDDAKWQGKGEQFIRSQVEEKLKTQEDDLKYASIQLQGKFKFFPRLRGRQDVEKHKDLLEDKQKWDAFVEEISKKINNVVYNRTFFVYKGDIIAQYDKRTYFNECNDLILGKATKHSVGEHQLGGSNLSTTEMTTMYYFGTGKIQADEKKGIDRLISMEICRDFELEVRKKVEETVRSTEQGEEPCLHVIQSNFLGFNGANRENLPLNRLTVVADSKESSGLYIRLGEQNCQKIEKQDENPLALKSETCDDVHVGFFVFTVQASDGGVK